MEFEAAEISITTCTENHVHIRLKPLDGGGPTYDTHFDADTARRFACTVLEAAADIAPVS